MLKVTTKSGAVYHIKDGIVKGGSKNLKRGILLLPPCIGSSLVMSTPERSGANPDAELPSVYSSRVVSVEEVDDD